MRLRLIWTDDPGTTYRAENPDKVVGLILGDFESFSSIPSGLENELIEVLRKHSIIRS